MLKKTIVTALTAGLLSTIFACGSGGGTDSTSPPAAEATGTTSQALGAGYYRIDWPVAGVYHSGEDLCTYHQVDALHAGQVVYASGNVSCFGYGGERAVAIHYNGNAGWVREGALAL